MAKLNIYQQQTRPSSTAGPQASAQAFGAGEGQALQQFGTAMSGLGQAIHQKEEKLELSKAKQKASELIVQQIQAQEDWRRAAPEDGSGHTDSVLEQVDTQWNELGENYTGKAREYIEGLRQSSQQKFASSESAYEATLRGEHLSRVEADQRSNEVNAVYVSPDALPDLLAVSEDRVRSYQYDPESDAGYLTEAQTNALISEEREALFTSAGQGIVDSSSSVAEARAFREELNNEEWTTELSSKSHKFLVARADRKIEQLQREAERKSRVNRQAFNNAYRDYTAFLQGGGSPDTPDLLTDEGITAAYPDSPELAAQRIQDRNLYESNSPKIGVVVSGDWSEVQDVMEQANASLDSSVGSDNYGDRLKAVEILKTALAHRITQLQKAPAEYAIRNSDSLNQMSQQLESMSTETPEDLDTYYKMRAQFTDELVDEERRLGVPTAGLQVLTGSKISEFRDMFSSAMVTEGESLSAAIDQVRLESGKHFDIAMRNLYEEGIPRGVAAISEVSDPRIQANAYEGLKNFKLNKDREGIEESDYSAESTLGEFTDTFPSNVFAGSAQARDEYVRAVNALSLQYMINDVDDHKNKAYKDLVDSRYNFANRHNVRVPVDVPIPSGQLDLYLDSFSRTFDTEFADRVDWDSTRSLMAPDMSSDTIKSDILRSMDAGLVKIYTATDDSGAMFAAESGAPLIGVSGEPLVIPWADVKRGAEAEMRRERDRGRR